MVSNVTPNVHSANRASATKVAKGAEHEMPPQAHKAQSVGHLAKAAVALSGDNSPNALGKAASLIARQILDKAPVEQSPGDEPPLAAEPATDEETPAAADPVAEENEDASPSGVPMIDDTPVALQLLSDEPEKTLP